MKKTGRADSKLNREWGSAVRAGARRVRSAAAGFFRRLRLWQKTGLAVCLLFWITSYVIGLVCGRITGGLQDQTFAARWEPQGGDAQVSAYFADTGLVSEEVVGGMKARLSTRLEEASYGLTPTQIENGAQLLDYAYSGVGMAEISTPSDSVSVTAIGVGGDFFNFHPLDLMSGFYFSEDDSMKDRVLLDDKTAWRLFGSPYIIGESVDIGGKPHYVAGVFRTPRKRFYKQSGMGDFLVYMSYDSLCRYTEAGTPSDDSQVPGDMDMGSDLMDALEKDTPVLKHVELVRARAAAAWKPASGAPVFKRAGGSGGFDGTDNLDELRIFRDGDVSGGDSGDASGGDSGEASGGGQEGGSQGSPEGSPLEVTGSLEEPAGLEERDALRNDSNSSDRAPAFESFDQLEEKSDDAGGADVGDPEDPEDSGSRERDSAGTSSDSQGEEDDERITGDDAPVGGNLSSGDDYGGYGDGEAVQINRSRISCYDVVLPNPLTNYAVNAVNACLVASEVDMGQTVVVENTSRYDAGRLALMIVQPGLRSMQSVAIRYPYWENVARAWEDVLIPYAALQLFMRFSPFLFLLFLVLWYATHRSWTVGGEIQKIRDRIYDRQSEKLYGQNPAGEALPAGEEDKSIPETGSLAQPEEDSALSEGLSGKEADGEPVSPVSETGEDALPEHLSGEEAKGDPSLGASESEETLQV